ncbi:MAG: UDP-N-acetylmuramoyl-tripeptide--D-alanyl-D-alanine ligase [Verrucomicrobiota bacterium]|jgi:UDP-N-acetylmuramoyl-tripeptide--D-alanyl-D-alanine ligase|nr:UDP-N-acetylmuramoyl-tripeptide--D-alanyl-D-alanine ligase [Verrucomicrobiota bacterium]
MHAISTEQAARWCGGQWVPRPPEGPLDSISIDSRTARPGTLFFALPGTRYDGHAFLPAVAAAGAYAVIRKSIPVEGHAGAVLRVEDPLTALGNLAGSYRREFSARVIGITGSVGKTSTKELAANLLSCMGKTVRTFGNFNNEIGVPLSLLQLEPDSRYGVFEAGIAHPGEMAPLRDMMQPDIVLVTRIGPVHIEFFDSVQAIAEEKAVLLEQLPPNGFALLDRDDACFSLLRARCAAPVIACSMREGPADYTGRWTADGRLLVHEAATGEHAAMAAPPPGAFMAENALKAVALGRRLGATWEQVAAGLAMESRVGMRWAVEERAGVVLINDAYNANPVSLRAAAQAFAEWPVSGRRFLALGPMLSLGRLKAAEHRALGRWLAAGNWAGIGLVPMADPDAVEELRAGFLDGGFPKDALHSGGYASVAAWLQDRMEAGDALLLKASRGVRMEALLGEWKDGS